MSKSLSGRRHLLRGSAILAALVAMTAPAAAQTVDLAAAEPEADGQPSGSAPTSDAREIVVTATGYAQRIENAPASITLIPREELQQERFNNLADALVDVEGVDVGATAGKTGGLTISMRGMPSDYTLILIDGRRQNAPGNVTPNGFNETSTSFIPPLSAVERIEVVRGPMSTLYGSDAMGGVINIITRQVGDRWSGTASLNTTIQGDGDFGNTYGATGYIHGPVVKDLIGLSVNGSYLRRDAATLAYENVGGVNVPITSFGASPTEADIMAIGSRLSVTPHPDHDVWLQYDYSDQRYDNSTSQLGTATTQGGYGPEQRFRRDQWLAAHNWRLGFGQLETTLSRQTTETIGRTIPPNTPGATTGDPRTLRATNSIAETRLTGEVGPVAFAVGGQWWNARMVDGVAPAPYEFDQWALYAEGGIEIVPSLTLTLGGRYDDHSTFGGKFSPRGYVVFNATDWLTLKGGVSRGFRTPQLNQIATGIVGFGGQGTIPLIGSPGLTPETSTSYEAGVYFDLPFGLSGNVTVFNNDFIDKIASGPGIPNCRFALAPNRPGCLDVGNFPNVDLFGQSINIDEAVTRGIEASVRYRIGDSVTIGANYTYTDSEQKTGPQAGLPLIGTPEHMFNANVRWNATDRLNLWARTEIRSSRYRGAGAAQNALGDFRAYELFHLGAGFELTENIRLNATIYNVLDRNFVRYLPYPQGNGTVYAQEYANNQEPRRLYLSATFDF